MREYTSKAVRVYFDEESGAVISDWGAHFIKGKEYRDGLNAALQIIKDCKAKKYIAHTLKRKVLTTEDQMYTNDVFMPEFIRLGVKRVAVIMPKDPYSKISLKNVLKSVHQPAVYKPFETFEEGYEWIKNERPPFD